MEQYQTDGQRVGLNAWQLKLIAIVAMVIDHLAFSFVPDGTFLAVAMHFIGSPGQPCFILPLRDTTIPVI